MNWKIRLSSELDARAPGGYAAAGPAATEPTALAALALAATDLHDAAVRCGDWLQSLQSRDGSVGIMLNHPAPQWPTGLALLAWQGVDRSAYGDAISRATQWALAARGSTMPRKRQFGHDTTLAGWAWATGTHSWLEPTAFYVLALKAVGLGDHPRTREGVQLLVDRLLPDGGGNYGNTVVLGQQLMPRIQATGIALWALGGESVQDERLGKSIDYLERELSAKTAPTSLCFGLLGLAAHDRIPIAADRWLEAAFRRVMQRGTSCYQLALLALAASLRSAPTIDESPPATY